MSEWLVVWGVAQAAGLVFKPILEDLAKESAKDYAKDFFKDCLKKVIHQPEKDPLKEAYGKALTQFLLLVQQELERADYEEVLIKEYVKPLKDFVNQEKIAATLGSAFNSDAQGLDIQIMAVTWREMNLPFLPEEFDWGQISKRYLKRVKNIIKDSDQLQPILLLAANCLAEVRNRKEIAPIATRLLQVLKKEVEAEYPYRFDEETAAAILMAIATNWQDDSNTLILLKDWAQNDADFYVRYAAVQAIARGWKDDLNTLILLKNWTQNHANYVVRRAGVRELVRGWKDDPDTLILLQDRVQNDADDYVRLVAVEELARGWKDDPDTLILLQDRAQNDADSWVRGGAVEELARGWKDTPGMFELLCDRALNDPFTRDDKYEFNPRQTALEAIFSNYHDHPQTLDLLRDRADNDPDEQVRNFAKNLLERRKRAE